MSTEQPFKVEIWKHAVSVYVNAARHKNINEDINAYLAKRLADVLAGNSEMDSNWPEHNFYLEVNAAALRYHSPSYEPRRVSIEGSELHLLVAHERHTGRFDHTTDFLLLTKSIEHKTLARPVQAFARVVHADVSPGRSEVEAWLAVANAAYTELVKQHHPEELY